MAELDAQIGLTADASGVEAGVGRAKKSLASLGASATKMGQDVAGAGDKASKALGGLGDGGEKSAKKIERDTKSMQSSIQRYIATLEAGSKDSRKYWEQMADFKGVDKNALRPLLDQLDRVTANTKVAKSATSDWRSELTRLGPLMASVFSGAAMLGVGTKLVAVQREFDVLNSSLKTVTGSSAAAEREMAWLKDFAKETPFGLAQATQGFVKMKALGLDPTRASLTSFGNTASAMGKDLNQMIEAVADASTGEFERLKEFGIKAKKEGDNVSLTFQGVTTTIKNSAAEITAYLEQIGNNQFGGAMEERARTLDGAIAGLGDTWDELFRTVNERNAGTLIHDSVKLANGAIEDATTILRAMTGAANDNAAATGAMSTIQNGIATVFETVAVLGANLSYVLQGVGREIGGLAAQVAQAAQFNFAGVSAIREQMVADAESARREIDATTARILNARKAQEEYARWATRNASAATDPRRVDLGGGVRETATAAAKPRKAAIDAEARAYENLIKTINTKIATEELELAGGEKLTDSQRLRVQFAQELQTSLKGLSAAKVAEYTADLNRLEALERENTARKEFLQIAEQERQQRLKIAQAAEQSVDSLATGNQQLRDEIQLIGLSATEQMEVLRLREESVLLVKGQHLAEMKRSEDLTGTMTRERIALEQEIELRRERLNLMGDKATKEQFAESNREMNREWQRTVDQYGDVFRQGFADMLNNGKDGWKSFTRSLVTTFKTTVADQIYKMFAQPFVVQLVGSIVGMTGGGTGGAAMQMASGGSSGIMGLVGNAGGSLLSSLTGGSITGIGSAASLWGGLNGTILPAGMMGPSVAAPTLMSGAGNMLAAIPGWGWALAGVGALLGSVLGRKVEKRGYGLMGTLGEEDGIHDLDLMRKGGSLLGGPKWFVRDTGVSEMDKALQETYKQQRDALIDMGKALGLATDGVENFTVQLGSDELGDKKVRGIRLDGLSDEEAQKKIAEALATANNEIAQQIIGTWERTVREVERIDISRPTDVGDTTDYGVPNVIRESIVDERYIPSEFARDGEQAIDTLTRLATSITGVNAIFDTLGLSVYEASLSAADAASSFVDLFGGLENLNAAAQTYYQNFYSEDERRAKAREGMDKVFDDLGIERINYDDPEARKKYREIVEREQARMVQEQQNREALRANFTGLILPEGGMPDAGSIGDIVRDFLGDTVGEMTDGAMDQLNGLISDFDTGALSLEGFTGSVMELIGASDDAGLSAEETVAALLNASGAFAAVTQSSDDAAESARRLAEEEERKAEEARRKAEEAVDLAFRNLQAATDRQLKSIDKQREALSAQRDSYAESLSLITGIFDIVRSNARELYGEVADTASMQAAQGMLFIEDALAAARATGALPESDALSQAIQAARRGITDGAYVSQFERDRDTLVLAGQLSALEEISGKQKTFEEQQIERLDEQLKGLDKQSKQLQEQLDYWREQIDISRGAYDATLSVEQALRGIEALIKPKDPAAKPTAPGGTSGSGGSTGGPVFGGGARPAEPEAARYRRMVYGGTAGVGYSAIRDESLIARLDKLAPVYHAFDGTGDLVGLAEAFKAAGGTIADLSILSGNWESDWRKAFASVGIPAFAVGTNYVPRDMLAHIHEGEAIVPKAFNPWAGGQGMQGGNAELIAEMRALREEVAQLKSINAATAVNTSGLPQMVDQFDNVTEGGNGMRRGEVVA